MRTQQDSWHRIPPSARRSDGVAFVRVVALDNLRAMCTKMSGNGTAFEIVNSAHANRVAIRFTDLSGKTPLTLLVEVKAETSPWPDDEGNPRVCLDVVRTNVGRDPKVRAKFEPLFTAPTVWRDPETGAWRTHGEIRAAGDEKHPSIIDTCTFCDIEGGNRRPPRDLLEPPPPPPLDGQDPASPIDPEALCKMRERGGDWFAYENQDLSSRLLGHLQYLKCGTDCTFEVPPKNLPDGGSGPGFRYFLKGRVVLSTGLIGGMSFALLRGDTYLAETSAHRGSQAGTCRVWSLEQARALRFDTREEAERVVSSEFSSDELRYDPVEIVPVTEQ